MKTNKPSIRFWTVLGVINAVAMVYPVQLMLQGSSSQDSFLATLVLIVVVFLLGITDIVSILVACSLGGVPTAARRHGPVRCATVR